MSGKRGRPCKDTGAKILAERLEECLDLFSQQELKTAKSLVTYYYTRRSLTKAQKGLARYLLAIANSEPRVDFRIMQDTGVLNELRLQP